jgi:hypothetical protein
MLSMGRCLDLRHGGADDLCIGKERESGHQVAIAGGPTNLPPMRARLMNVSNDVDKPASNVGTSGGGLADALEHLISATHP